MTTPTPVTNTQLRQFAKDTARETDLLRTLMTKQQNMCFWCGRKMTRKVFYDGEGKVIDGYLKATVDHLITVAAGGATDTENCVAACSACNVLRSQFNPGAYQKVQDDLKAEVEKTARLKKRIDEEQRKAKFVNRAHRADGDRISSLQQQLALALAKKCPRLTCRIREKLRPVLDRIVNPIRGAFRKNKGESVGE